MSSVSKYTNSFFNTNNVIMLIVSIISILTCVVTITYDRATVTTTLINNTKSIEDLKGQINKFNEYSTQQSELNGKIIQFMEMQKSEDQK